MDGGGAEGGEGCTSKVRVSGSGDMSLPNLTLGSNLSSTCNGTLLHGDCWVRPFCEPHQKLLFNFFIILKVNPPTGYLNNKWYLVNDVSFYCRTYTGSRVH